MLSWLTTTLPRGLTESGKLASALARCLLASRAPPGDDDDHQHHQQHHQQQQPQGAADRVVDPGADLVVFAVFALALGAANWALRTLVAKPLGNLVLRDPRADPAAALTAKQQKRVDKFSQALVELVFYASFAYGNCVVTMSQPWSWPSSRWWADWAALDPSTGHPVHALSTQAMSAYFILYAARYFQALVATSLEHRRKDFVEMQIHHTVTCLLVGTAYAFAWTRVGLCVMLTLDPADVPLQAAKTAKYLSEARRPKQPNNAFATTSDVLFVLFMLTFFVTRLGMYPYIVWSSEFETRHIARPQYPYWGEENLSGRVCQGLLLLLLLLQVFWGGLIVKVLVKLLKHGHVEDERSDDEGGDDQGAGGKGKDKGTPITRKKTN